MAIPRWIRVGAILLLTADTLVACSFSEEVADHAIDYNKAVADAANKAILINILRARDRKPMHFTALSQVRGSLEWQGESSISGEFPFGGDADSAFGVSPSIGMSGATNPSFDIAILDSQKFFKGILSPIDVGILDYYWQQGWPRELLLHLFIHRIDFDPPVWINGKRYSRLINSPQFAEFAKFQQMIRALRGLGLQTGTVSNPKGIGPELSKEDVSNLKHLVAAGKAGFRVTEIEPGSFQLQKGKPEFVFCFEVDIKKGRRCKTTTGNADNQSSIPATLSIPIDILEGVPKFGVAIESLGVSDRNNENVQIDLSQAEARGIEDVTAVLVIRSIEAMLFYVGEVVRHGGVTVQFWKAYPDGKPEAKDEFGELISVPLFVLSSRPNSKWEIETSLEYDGERYSVPKVADSRTERPGGRTMHVLSLLSQLLALQKSSDEIPTTRAVTVVGQ